MAFGNRSNQAPLDRERLATILGVDPYTLPTGDLKKGVASKAESYVGDLGDEEYEVLAQFATARFSDATGVQDRTTWDGLIWLTRTGRPQTHLPPRYGSVDSVRKRVERWAIKGLFDTLLEALTDLSLTDPRRAELQSIAEREAKRGRRIRELRASAESMANQPRVKKHR